jgi:hypothetical protein
VALGEAAAVGEARAKAVFRAAHLARLLLRSEYSEVAMLVVVVVLKVKFDLD